MPAPAQTHPHHSKTNRKQRTPELRLAGGRSRWERRKRPQLEWMLDRITEAIDHLSGPADSVSITDESQCQHQVQGQYQGEGGGKGGGQGRALPLTVVDVGGGRGRSEGGQVGWVDAGGLVLLP